MWYKVSGQTVTIQMFVKPNARQSAIIGINEHGLCISLKARPKQGEANQALISYLAKLFEVPKSKITLIRGEASRHKAVKLPWNEAVEAVIVSLDL